MTVIYQDRYFNAEEVATIEWMTDYVMKRSVPDSYRDEGRFSSMMKAAILRSKTREAVVECIKDGQSMQKIKRLRQRDEFALSELKRIFGLER